MLDVVHIHDMYCIVLFMYVLYSAVPWKNGQPNITTTSSRVAGACREANSLVDGDGGGWEGVDWHGSG